MPLVPETKMADISKLMSLETTGQESHVVCAHNYVLNFDFVPRFWSRLHDKDWLYILSSFKNSFFLFRLTETTHSLTLWLTKITHSLHFDPQRQYTLSLLHFDFQHSNPRKCIHSATFFFLVRSFRLDLLQPQKPQKFRQTTKRNKQPTWEKTRSS